MDGTVGMAAREGDVDSWFVYFATMLNCGWKLLSSNFIALRCVEFVSLYRFKQLNQLDSRLGTKSPKYGYEFHCVTIISFRPMGTPV
jgi:hypothetical protein